MPRLITILVLESERSRNSSALSGRGWARGIANVKAFRGFTSPAPVKRSFRGFSPSMSKPKKIFVTGTTGFLGSHLTCRLLQDGHHVSVLARGTRNVSPRSRVVETLQGVGWTNFRNLDVYEGDIALHGLGLSEATTKQLVANADEVWHCAA